MKRAPTGKILATSTGGIPFAVPRHRQLAIATVVAESGGCAPADSVEPKEAA